MYTRMQKGHSTLNKYNASEEKLKKVYILCVPINSETTHMYTCTCEYIYVGRQYNENIHNFVCIAIYKFPYNAKKKNKKKTNMARKQKTTKTKKKKRRIRLMNKMNSILAAIKTTTASKCLINTHTHTHTHT